MSPARHLAAIRAVDVVCHSRLTGEEVAGTTLIVRESLEAARFVDR